MPTHTYCKQDQEEEEEKKKEEEERDDNHKICNRYCDGNHA